MIGMIFFGDLVGSVVSISKQTRKNSPRGIMMTELLNLKVLSNQTSGLVVGGGEEEEEGRGVDQALVFPCTNPCVENLLLAFSRRSS